MDTVRLSVPGTLQYRDVVLRVVASVCRLVRYGSGSKQEANPGKHIEDFDDKVVSAVSEAFNNIAIHAYGRVQGKVELEIGFELNTLTIRLQDTGDGFNLSSELGHELAQGLGTLRESHMGLEIIFACMDEVTYARGGPTTPNVLTMTKRYSAHPAAPTLDD
jgi:anti-sigma regulatory factor (Ser/Thr protein kinase)